MRISVKVAENDLQSFDDYDDAMDYIESFMPDIESGMLNTDDIIIEYHD